MQPEQCLTPAQLRKIWASARELSWDDARLHQELERVIGISSLRELSRQHGKLFIDYMVSEGASSGRHFARSCQVDGPRREPCPANVIELATPAQQHFIDELLADLGWNRQTDYFLGCLKRATGRTTVRTRNEARGAITILKKLKARILGERAATEPQNGGQVGDT